MSMQQCCRDVDGTLHLPHLPTGFSRSQINFDMCSKKLVFIICAAVQGLDQPAHRWSLIKVFAVCMNVLPVEDFQDKQMHRLRHIFDDQRIMWTDFLTNQLHYKKWQVDKLIQSSWFFDLSANTKWSKLVINNHSSRNWSVSCIC